jgi:hypothetical protein
MKKFKGLLAAATLVAAVLVPSAPSSAALVAPRSAWAACSALQTEYCVSSAQVQKIGAVAETLTFAPATATGGDFSGIWTSTTWAVNHSTAGYDGIFIKIAPANKFVNHLYIDVVPVKLDGGKVMTAKGADSSYAVDLLEDETITFTADYGDILPGVNIGQGLNVNVDTAGGQFTISGNPVSVSFSENTNDYKTGTSTADATTNTLSIFILVENDDMGFGVEGLTGKMSVITNAPDTSTPSWNKNTGEMTWVAQAPHFKVDGDINDGFYRSVIPAADAAVLWGLTNPADAATALNITVANNVSQKTVAIKLISYNSKLDAIIMEHSGFQYSKNTFKIKKNPKYKKFSSIKVRNCKQKNASLPGPNVLKQRAGACPAGYKGK